MSWVCPELGMTLSNEVKQVTDVEGEISEFITFFGLFLGNF